MVSEKPKGAGRSGLGKLLGRDNEATARSGGKPKPPKWSMGVLNDRTTIEVPGSVLLLAAHKNEPLGLRNVHARSSHSSIPAGFPVDAPMTPGGTRPMPTGAAHPSPPVTPLQAPASGVEAEEKKKTEDGTIILEPQPDDSANDPLNWPAWRRDSSLLSLGFYCMVGGGITPLIAAGFPNVAESYHVHEETVALTTGLYMMGLGIGSVIFSPTAILFGKRPVYLFSAIMFIATSIWCGFSPSFNSLLAARVFQGISVSPVECLPSATIAEIFFLHERAYRIGIYTLLLLGGKNLVPLVSAAIIGRFGWRWAFWIVAMIVALCGILLFFFVPETFWDRTPTRKPHGSRKPSFLRRFSSQHGAGTPREPPILNSGRAVSPGAAGRAQDAHVGFAQGTGSGQPLESPGVENGVERYHTPETPEPSHQPKINRVGWADASGEEPVTGGNTMPTIDPSNASMDAERMAAQGGHVATPRSAGTPPVTGRRSGSDRVVASSGYGSSSNVDYFFRDNEKMANDFRAPPKVRAYTHNLRQQPAQSFVQQLKPFHGRLNNDNWFKVALRPFILFAYPAVLWSSIVYACSIGWLIVISETLSMIYRNPNVYNFTALETGLVYISPFVGGILGTAVAGKISDIIVKAMSRRNGGLYEPEFRLVMAMPILVTTCIGLMGFGWSAQEKDHWIVPTLFFGIVSFGCSLGSTTSITFCVDSYRQYAGEALVTLNFSKNIFHGLVFSFFVTHWLVDDGAKMVFIWIGIIQLFVMLTTIPMYIYGKRARMWTVRMNLMEKF